MDYMRQIDELKRNALTHPNQTYSIHISQLPVEYPAESLFWNSFVFRIYIPIIWVVNCAIFYWRMYPDGTLEGHLRDHMLLRYMFVYGVASLASHIFFLVHLVIDNTAGRDEANYYATSLFTISILTSYFLRTMVLLYIYSRLEFSLARIPYPFGTRKHFNRCIYFCIFLAIAIFAVQQLTKSYFQLIIDIDYYNVFIMNIILLLCERLLRNEISTFINLNSRKVHRRILLTFEFIFTLLYAAFVAGWIFSWYQGFNNLYELYSAPFSDLVFNAQPVVILISIATGRFRFGSEMALMDDAENIVPLEQIRPRPFIMLWNNFWTREVSVELLQVHHQQPRDVPPTSSRSVSDQDDSAQQQPSTSTVIKIDDDVDNKSSVSTEFADTQSFHSESEASFETAKSKIDDDNEKEGVRKRSVAGVSYDNVTGVLLSTSGTSGTSSTSSTSSEDASSGSSSSPPAKKPKGELPRPASDCNIKASTSTDEANKKSQKKDLQRSKSERKNR